MYGSDAETKAARPIKIEIGLIYIECRLPGDTAIRNGKK